MRCQNLKRGHAFSTLWVHNDLDEIVDQLLDLDDDHDDNAGW